MEKISASKLLAGLVPEGFLTGDPEVELVTTDSREVKPGCIFVAFPGEKFDGHNFAAKALEDGAAFVVVNHPVEGVPAEKAILCPDSYHAMMVMGANYRSQYHPKMVGVTGSVGKTTTKQMTYAALAGFGETIKTEGNQNNELGMPRTLMRLEKSTEYAVIEMGMSHASGSRRPAGCGHHHLHRCVPHRQSGQPGEHLQGKAGDLQRPARGCPAGAELRRPLPAQGKAARACAPGVV